MVFDVDIEDPLERIQAAWDLLSGHPSEDYFDGQLYRALRPYSAAVHSPSRCTAIFLLKVERYLCNRMENLHGGAAATILDLVTSIGLAPIARGESKREDGTKQPSFWQWAGVSRTLSCTYLRPVPLGMTVAIICDTTSLTKRLATLRGELREFDEETQTIKDEVLVLCEHGKVAIEPKGLEPKI